MYVYVSNNYINLCDSTGEFAIPLTAGYTLVTLALAVVGLATTKSLSSSLPGMVSSAVSEAKSAARSVSKALSKTEQKSSTCKVEPPQTVVIYRYGNTKSKNLTPRLVDVQVPGYGLSFSTLPPTDVKKGAAVTTIDAINATGVLYAVRDGNFHVSVYPVGATIADWYFAGPDSIWTKTLESVVVKWDGGS